MAVPGIRASIAAMLFTSASALAGGNVTVTWQNATYAPNKLPENLPTAARTAIAAWDKWAKDHEYRMDLDKNARLLLVTPADRSASEKQMEVVATTCKWFDEIVPVPERRSAPKPADAASKEPPQRPDDVIPEDPESAPVGAPPPKPAKTKPAAKAATWGAVDLQPDTQTGVMLVLRDEKEYATALDELGRAHAYLKDWLVSARKNTGFVLEVPLCGAYVENAAGQEEWDPRHELLNRVTQMLLVSRFGQLPNWIVQGLAWEAEMNFDATVYCFPYRDEFVFTVEHGAWPSDVRNKFRDRASDPLKMDEFAMWKRGTYQQDAAQTAWGVTHFLTTQHRQKLSAMLEDFRQAWDAKNRKTKPDGSWERIADFQLPADVQLQLLAQHVASDFLKKATAWLGSQVAETAKSGSR